MKKLFLISSIAIFVAVSLFAGYTKLFYRAPVENLNLNNSAVNEDNSGIEVYLPKPGETISSPLKITGIIKGNGWNGFEGQVGTVKLQDSTGKELALTYLPATTEWTQLPTKFETSLIFDAGNEVLGRLIFRNENASGDSERDKVFIMPVKFK